MLQRLARIGCLWGRGSTMVSAQMVRSVGAESGCPVSGYSARPDGRDAEGSRKGSTRLRVPSSAPPVVPLEYGAGYLFGDSPQNKIQPGTCLGTTCLGTVPKIKLSPK